MNGLIMVVLINNRRDETVTRICARHGETPDALIEILHEVQAEKRYISDDALRAIAECLNISRADIHGVVSFYHDFRREPPPGVIIRICRAEACQAVGAEALAAHAAAAYPPGGDVGIEPVYCLGNCALGPAVMVNGKLHARMTPEKLGALAANRGAGA